MIAMNAFAFSAIQTALYFYSRALVFHADTHCMAVMRMRCNAAKQRITEKPG